MNTQSKVTLSVKTRLLEDVRDAVAHLAKVAPELGLTVSSIFDRGAAIFLDRLCDEHCDTFEFPPREGRLPGGRPAGSADTEDVQAAALSTRQTAMKLAITPGSVRRLLRRGELPHVRVGGALRVPADAVDQYIATRRSTSWVPGRSPLTRK